MSSSAVYTNVDLITVHSTISGSQNGNNRQQSCLLLNRRHKDEEQKGLLRP